MKNSNFDVECANVPANICSSERVMNVFGVNDYNRISSILQDFIVDWESVTIDEDGPTKLQDELLDQVLEKYTAKILEIR